MKLYLKDYLTLGNVVCAMVSIALAMENNIAWASLFIWIAFVFDALDGLAARLTGKTNTIGSHLDNTADLIGYAVAPAVIVYVAYIPLLGTIGALALGSVPVIIGTIRHARNYANPPAVTNLWCGLPRPYSGLAMSAYVASHMFSFEIGQWIGIAFVLIPSFLGITAIGYQGRHHKGLRWFQRMFFILTIITWAVGVILAFLGYGLAFFHDGMLFWMFLYMNLAWWWLIEPEEYKKYYAYIAEWKKNF